MKGTGERPSPRSGGIALDRRSFTRLTVLAAGSIGSLVGFAPSAAAAPPSACDFGTQRLYGCDCPGNYQYPCTCIGYCTDTISECQFGPRSVDSCTVYNTSPNPDIGAKPLGKCDPVLQTGWCCGVYC